MQFSCGYVNVHLHSKHSAGTGVGNFFTIKGSRADTAGFVGFVFKAERSSIYIKPIVSTFCPPLETCFLQLLYHSIIGRLAFHFRRLCGANGFLRCSNWGEVMRYANKFINGILPCLQSLLYKQGISRIFNRYSTIVIADSRDCSCITPVVVTPDGVLYVVINILVKRAECISNLGGIFIAASSIRMALVVLCKACSICVRQFP